MVLEIDERLLRQAVATWGMDAQITMAMEECGELITAIAQFQRGRPGNVAEEIADVMIMVSQMRLIFGTAAVDEAISQKMERLRVKLREV